MTSIIEPDASFGNGQTIQFPKPGDYIIVYGDDADLSVTKIMWGALGSDNVKIKNINDIQDFIELSSSSLLNIICVDDTLSPDDDPANRIVRLDTRMQIPGGIVALSRSEDIGQHVKLLAMGYDSTFSLNMAQSIDFHRIISHKVAKTRIRIASQMVEGDYHRFRAAIQASPDAFIVLDPDRRIFYVSNHYTHAYPRVADRLVRGLPVREAFDIVCNDQGLGESDPRYATLRAFWENLSGTVEFETGGLTDRRHWRVRATDLGADMGWIVTTSDITDITRQHQDLEDKSQKLAEALASEQDLSALQKQFIAMVSHEFRTPLAIIDGNAQMLQRQVAETPGADPVRLKTIRRAVARLIHMMEGVLSSNLLQTGRLEPNKTDFNLGSLIQELCDEQTDLNGAGTIKVSTKTLPETVHQDAKMLTLILTNLLSNALKFSSQQPDIHVDSGATPDQAQIFLRVRDHGMGIPEEDIERIFDRYYRGANVSGIPGTGIGLSLVRDLVHFLGGTLSLKSTLGQGTVVTIFLPNLKS